MASYRFAIVVLVFLFAGPVNADIGCGYGPHSPTLDHSCSKDIDRLARAEMNVPAEWKKIPGVLGIGSGINVHHGFFVAIQVYVKAPSMIPVVTAQVPRSLDGVAVLVVTPEVINTGPATPTNCKSGRSNAPADSAYLPVEKEYGSEWMELPGVMGEGVSVQRRLLRLHQGRGDGASPVDRLREESYSRVDQWSSDPDCPLFTMKAGLLTSHRLAGMPQKTHHIAKVHTKRVNERSGMGR